jgi:hypothetical protein
MQYSVQRGKLFVMKLGPSRSCLLLLIFLTFAFLLFKPESGHVSPTSAGTSSVRSRTLRGSSEKTVAKRRRDAMLDSSSSSKALSQPPYDHLIIVAGHAVLDPASSRSSEGDYTDDAAWLLLSYQKQTGLPDVIIEHINAGINLSASLPRSLLIFSGGETRKSSGPLSEAASYFTVADALHMFPIESNDDVEKQSTRERTYTEEYATDSYENVLYSVCRFYEIAGVYPKDITVISFTFKEHRFTNIHAPAMNFPISNFHYIGIDPPASTSAKPNNFDLAASTVGERDNALSLFEEDPYGCYKEKLIQKRKERNPFYRTPPYSLTCSSSSNGAFRSSAGLVDDSSSSSSSSQSAYSQLLSFCGPERFAKMIPWGFSS